jgi:hypothetical protein
LPLRIHVTNWVRYPNSQGSSSFAWVPKYRLGTHPSPYSVNTIGNLFFWYIAPSLSLESSASQQLTCLDRNLSHISFPGTIYLVSTKVIVRNHRARHPSPESRAAPPPSRTNVSPHHCPKLQLATQPPVQRASELRHPSGRYSIFEFHIHMMDSASSPTGEFTRIKDGSNVHIRRSLLHYVYAYLRLLTGNAAILPPILPTSLPAILPAGSFEIFDIDGSGQLKP